VAVAVVGVGHSFSSSCYNTNTAAVVAVGEAAVAFGMRPRPFLSTRNLNDFKCLSWAVV